LKLDVTDAAALGETASQAATVVLPPASKLSPAPIICFARPGVQYNHLYYTYALPAPGHAPESQAHYHASHGWIFVALDYLGAGASSAHDGMKLTYTVVARAFLAAETEILRRLADGELLSGYPKISNPVKIGMGQSMGGGLTIVQTGRYSCYDGIAILGFSAVHTHPPAKPGDPPIVAPWFAHTPPGEPPILLNQRALEAFKKNKPQGYQSAAAMAWGFHYDDVDPGLIAEDFKRFDRDVGDAAAKKDWGGGKVTVPPWGCLNTPAASAMVSVTPGAVAPEAAAITCPVLVVVGERDVIGDPKGEPRAYESASSVDLYVVPRMGHMHNFAGSRNLLWKRIETWGEWVRHSKDLHEA